MTGFFPPAGAAGVIGCGRLRAASVTFSPRAPHALLFLLCLSVSASSAEWQQRGSRTPQSGLLAVAWLQAAMPHHWLRDCRASHLLAKRGEK